MVTERFASEPDADEQHAGAGDDGRERAAERAVREEREEELEERAAHARAEERAVRRLPAVEALVGREVALPGVAHAGDRLRANAHPRVLAVEVQREKKASARDGERKAESEKSEERRCKQHKTWGRGNDSATQEAELTAM
eukprot:3934705-Rhodomonas_salina.2